MRPILFLIFLFSPVAMLANDSLLRKKIYAQVMTIEKQVGKVDKFRWLLGTFAYKTVEGEITKIVHDYDSGPRHIIKVFYIQDATLLYASETETAYYLAKDSSIWNASYYFKNGELADYLTLGHGKSELDGWKPGVDMLKDFKEALSVINRNRRRTITNNR